MAQTWRKTPINARIYAHQKAWIDRMITAEEFASYSHALRVMIDFYKFQTGKGYYTFKIPQGDKEVISRH